MKCYQTQNSKGSEVEKLSRRQDAFLAQRQDVIDQMFSSVLQGGKAICLCSSAYSMYHLGKEIKGSALLWLPNLDLSNFISRNLSRELVFSQIHIRSTAEEAAVHLKGTTYCACQGALTSQQCRTCLGSRIH